MWNCPSCNAEVDDRFDTCSKCGTGRDGSEPPVDFVRKGDAYQPGLPAAKSTSSKNSSRVVSVVIVLIVIITLIIVALNN